MADSRMIHRGLFALAGRSLRGEWDFHSPAFPLVSFPVRERGPGSGSTALAGEGCGRPCPEPPHQTHTALL